jgi:hypothetical protein
MLSRDRSTVRTLDTKSRSSTGIIYPPLVPVDDVDLAISPPSTSATRLRAGDTMSGLTQPPTSVELVRKLEACVRELLEISLKGR